MSSQNFNAPTNFSFRPMIGCKICLCSAKVQREMFHGENLLFSALHSAVTCVQYTLTYVGATHKVLLAGLLSICRLEMTVDSSTLSLAHYRN